jgi:isopenicillin N synthase-like dioxygenase
MAPEKTKYIDRPIPTISLANYESRIDEITSQLVSAAENVGFFSIVDHGITAAEIDNIFSQSARFFSLPDEVKAKVPFSSANNAGWEKNAQVRPSTGAADRKESYQMQFGRNMEGKWLDDDALPGFKDSALEFMRKAQAVSERLMVCLARGLGFPDDYFVKAHDVKRPESQTVARLLHYFETPKVSNGEVWHRAGAHTDWDLLTLLFQKQGQSGLEVCATCTSLYCPFTQVPIAQDDRLTLHLRSVPAAKPPPPSRTATPGPKSTPPKTPSSAT